MIDDYRYDLKCYKNEQAGGSVAIYHILLQFTTLFLWVPYHRGSIPMGIVGIKLWKVCIVYNIVFLLGYFLLP